MVGGSAGRGASQTCLLESDEWFDASIPAKWESKATTKERIVEVADAPHESLDDSGVFASCPVGFCLFG